MSTVKQIVKMFSADDDHRSLAMAINAYDKTLWDRNVLLERIPLDALVFAEHQTPYTTESEFQEKRCRFDRETNEWLEHYVLKMATSGRVPPILVMMSETGVVLIDGVHRASALLMHTKQTHIDAWVIYNG